MIRMSPARARGQGARYCEEDFDPERDAGDGAEHQRPDVFRRGPGFAALKSLRNIADDDRQTSRLATAAGMFLLKSMDWLRYRERD